MDNLTSIIEAIVFASGKGIHKKEILEKLPEVSKSQLEKSIEELRKKYSKEKNSGIIFFTYGEKLTFSSNDYYGDVVTTVLTPLKERELSRALLEVLSLIAYKQPITRLDIEDIRGVNSDYAISVLSKANLITVVGRKDTLGRPMLYGTTEDFLVKFELENINDLPNRKNIQERIKVIETESEKTKYLFEEVAADIADNFDAEIDEESAKKLEDEYPLMDVED